MLVSKEPPPTEHSLVVCGGNNVLGLRVRDRPFDLCSSVETSKQKHLPGYQLTPPSHKLEASRLSGPTFCCPVAAVAGQPKLDPRTMPITGH